MSAQTFIFECNSDTYLDCIAKSVFGSNKPWPTEIRAGDRCLLHHYELGVLLGLWEAAGDGGRNLVPRIWGGKFPFQVKIKLIVPKIVEVPKTVLSDLGINAATGRFDPRVDDDLAKSLMDALLGKPF